MHPSTALDIVGIPYKRISRHTIGHVCPVCGDKAWSGRWYTQCWNTACTGQVFAPEDIVLLRCRNDLKEASKLVQATLGNPQTHVLAARQQRRKVLDFWIRECLAPRTDQTTEIIAKRTGGRAIGRFSTTAFDRSRMVSLVNLAEATGASYPDTWDEHTPPTPGLVFVVQTVPYIIDRIVIAYPHGDRHVVWRDRGLGINGLIGLKPHVGRLLTPDRETAMRAQSQLMNSHGEQEDVAFVYMDQALTEFSCEWEPDHPFVFYAGEPEGVVRLQKLITNMPALSSSSATVSLRSAGSDKLIGWRSARRGLLLAEIMKGIGDGMVPPTAASLFERSCVSRSDGVFMADTLVRQGQISLANDVRRLLTRRVLYVDDRITVTEDMNRILAKTRHGELEVANFCVDMQDTVTFAERADSCIRASVRCGTTETPVILSSQATLNVKRLQDEVAAQFLRRHKTEGSALPTIVDMKLMQAHVMPTLRRSLTGMRVIPGVSCLGWSADRGSFTMPGITVSVAGTSKNLCVFHPTMPLLTNYGPVDEWSEVLPKLGKCVALDMALAMLAQIVRFYKHGSMLPFAVSRDAATVDTVSSLMPYFGQHTVHALNPNARDRTNTDGVRGYPLVATGGSQSQHIPYGYVLLTESGLTEENPDRQVTETIGRFLQRAMTDVAVWCMKSRAEGYQEIKSLDHNSALVAEGAAIARVACLIQVPGSLSKSPAPTLEKLLSTIPVTDTGSRMTLGGDMKLEIDLGHVTEDEAASITHELTVMGSSGQVEGQSLICDAVTMVPALTRFYGRRPEPRVTAPVL